MKFTSSQAVDIVGVRIYRTDAGPVSASLWNSSGGRLAGPTSAAGAATHGWQDVLFSAPVAIAPGQTYTASYLAPSGDYPFQWDFFASAAFTQGPITALQSSNDNGAYCYSGASCFPTQSFRDTNYWVTPLWTTGSGGPVTYGSLADGAHSVTATAFDGDGVSTPNAAFAWTVHHAAPDITTDLDALTNSTGANFSFSDSPFTSFECSLDGAAFAACDGGTASYTGLDDGSHTFAVHAVDSIGGTTADQTFTWTVDTTAPTVDVEPADGQDESTNALPIHFTATFDEPVNAFTDTGVTLGGSADTSGATVTVTQSSPTKYDIEVDGVTGSGTVTASVNAAATTDPAGNENTASGASPAVTLTP